MWGGGRGEGLSSLASCQPYGYNLLTVVSLGRKLSTVADFIDLEYKYIVLTKKDDEKLYHQQFKTHSKLKIAIL